MNLQWLINYDVSSFLNIQLEHFLTNESINIEP